METGTGKTYVYTKTIMELHKRYGWSKYMVVVPSIAIREGVKKSFDITAGHFQQLYGTKPRTFVYNSSRLHDLEQFSSAAGVQVMIINIQAFNATGKDARRIYEVLDDFQSRKPIDVIAVNRPILIIDFSTPAGTVCDIQEVALTCVSHTVFTSPVADTSFISVKGRASGKRCGLGRATGAGAATRRRPTVLHRARRRSGASAS